MKTFTGSALDLLNLADDWGSEDGLAAYIIKRQPSPFHYCQGSTKGWIRNRRGDWERDNNFIPHAILDMRDLLRDIADTCDVPPESVQRALKVLGKPRGPGLVEAEIKRQVRISPREFDRLIPREARLVLRAEMLERNDN